MSMNENGKNRSIAIAMAMILMGTLVGCATGGGGATSPLVGTWKLTSDWGIGESDQILVVRSDLTGTLEDLGESWTSDLSNVTSEGNAVRFDFLYSGAGGYETSFEGTITGAAIEGEFTIGAKSAPVFGARN